MSLEQLQIGLKACEEDDPELMQCFTVAPSPNFALKHLPVNAACLTSYLGWKGKGLRNVQEVSHYFAEACHQADVLLGEDAGCRHLLNFWDDHKRAKVLALMAEELRENIKERLGKEAVTTKEEG